MEEELSNMIAQKPHSAMTPAPVDKSSDSGPTDAVLYEMSAMMAQAPERGHRRGCPGARGCFMSTGRSEVEGILRTRAIAIATKRMPVCSARNDSSAVRVVRRSAPLLSARNKRNRGNSSNGVDAVTNTAAAAQAQYDTLSETGPGAEGAVECWL